MNAHKGLGVPIISSILMINNHLGALESANSTDESNLDHYDLYSEYDFGNKSLQCSRKCDSLKFWMFWKRYGIEGIK
jgi:hypothetical protein